jgi:hypothetical protein
MEQVIRAGVGPREGTAENQAYQLLHWGFVLAPALAGADKFFHLLTNWDKYVAPPIARILPFSAHTFMLIVGAIELLAAVIVAVKPRIGGYVVAGWLGAIIVNLLISRAYYDIALRDFGLLLGALALARLSLVHDQVAGRTGSRAPSPVSPNRTAPR